MESALAWFVFSFVAACLVGGIAWVCKRFNVPQIAQWFVAGIIIIILLYGLIRIESGVSPHLPRLGR